MATTAKLMVVIGARADDFTRAMNNVQRDLRAIDRQFRSTAQVGNTLATHLTIPLMAIGAAAFVAASDMQKANSIIRAGTGATGEALQALNDDFKAVFKTVPAGADQVAMAIADLNTRTGQTGEGLQDLARRSVELASLTGGDLKTQIQATTRTFGDWSIAAEKQGEALDYFYKVSQTTGIGIEQLGQRLVQFGAPLRQMGFDFETAAALMGKFEREGVNTELVLGSLRIALGKMSTEGIKDPTEGLQMIIQRIKEAGSAGEANSLAIEMFGRRAGPDMAAAIREGRFELDDLMQTLNGSSETILKAAEDARTFGQAMGILRNKATVALAPLGRAILDLFTAAQPTIERMAAGVERLSEKFAALSPETQRMIILGLGLVAALGPMLILLPQIVMSFILLTSGAKALGVVLRFLALNPIGLVITGVAALIMAGVWLYKNWDKVKNYGIQAWGELKLFILSSIDGILAGIEKFAGMVPVLGDKVREARASLSGSIANERGIVISRRTPGAIAGEQNDPIPDLAIASTAVTGVTQEYKALEDALDGVGNAAGGAGGKTTVAAQDTRAAWEKTADILSTQMQILKTQHDIAGMAAENQGNKVQGLALKSKQLSEQLTVQKDIVATVNTGYLESAASKEATAEETEKLRLKLVQEQKAQAEIEQQIRGTNAAYKEMSTHLKTLAADIETAAKKYRDDLMAAQEEYFRKVTEVNSKLVDDERRVTQEYENAVTQRARALMDFVGLFDQVAVRDVSGDQLLQNLRGQVDAFDNWQKNIGDLAAKGVDQGLIEELRQMGPKAGPEIAALNTLTDSQLTEYVALWRQKSENARSEAISQLESQRIETIQKIQELRAQATEQLEQYRQEWQKKNEEIRKNTMEEIQRIEDRYKAITESSTVYGQQLVENFAAGMQGRFDMLRAAVDEMRAITEGVDPAVRHSPSLIDRVNAGVDVIYKSYQRLQADMKGLTLVPPQLVPTPSGPTNNDNRQSITINVYGVEDYDRTMARLGVRPA